MIVDREKCHGRDYYCASGGSRRNSSNDTRTALVQAA